MLWRRALLGLAYRRASASSASLREFRERLQDSRFRLHSHFRTRRGHVYSETSRRAGLEFVGVFGHDELRLYRVAN